MLSRVPHLLTLYFIQYTFKPASGTAADYTSKYLGPTTDMNACSFIIIYTKNSFKEKINKSTNISLDSKSKELNTGSASICAV